MLTEPLRQLVDAFEDAPEAERLALIRAMFDEIDHLTLACGVAPGGYNDFQLHISRSYRKEGRTVTRTYPVWEARFRYRGHASDKTLGRAWTGDGESPPGYLNRAGAEAKLFRYLATLEPK